MTRYETRILFVGEIKCPILFQVGNINDTKIIPSVVFFKLNVAKASNNCMGASGKVFLSILVKDCSMCAGKKYFTKALGRFF